MYLRQKDYSIIDTWFTRYNVVEMTSDCMLAIDSHIGMQKIEIQKFTYVYNLVVLIAEDSKVNKCLWFDSIDELYWLQCKG